MPLPRKSIQKCHETLAANPELAARLEASRLDEVRTRAMRLSRAAAAGDYGAASALDISLATAEDHHDPAAAEIICHALDRALSLSKIVEILAEALEQYPEYRALDDGHGVATVTAADGFVCLRIYWDAQDPANEGWAWKTDDDSGPINDLEDVEIQAYSVLDRDGISLA